VKESTNTKIPGAFPLILSRIAPFLLPALFFQSAIFAFISPLPLFMLTLRNHLRVSAAALITNGVLLYYTGTSVEFSVALAMWVMIGILFPFLIRKTARIQLSFGLSLLVFLGLVLALLLAHTSSLGVGPIEYVKSEISRGITELEALPESPVKKIIEEQGRDDVFRQIVTEIPSGFIITLVLAFWVNLLFASQLMKGFLSKSFWANYRNPEWLVWPTLLSAGLFAFGDHALYYIGLNAFKVFLVFYGLQGLSVISHLLNRYKILGLGRAVVFCLAIFVMMPIVISLGFFDLWFDFRRKFGQS
jgi:hypothetical protein